MFPAKRQSARLLTRGLSAVALLLICILLSACGRGSFSGLETLPVDDYLEKPRNFLGNTYRLSAQIDSQIEWKEGLGRIMAVEAEGGTSRIPIFVPEIIQQNLHVGQRYHMRVNIREGGLVYVEDLRKY